MAEYKTSSTNGLVKTIYSYFGGRVSLANIADIRSLATRLGIPNDAKITITGGSVEFEYYLRSLDSHEDPIKPWAKR
jgi:hypothetical protein